MAKKKGDSIAKQLSVMMKHIKKHDADIKRLLKKKFCK